jgi:hypothetical protein
MTIFKFFNGHTLTLAVLAALATAAPAVAEDQGLMPADAPQIADVFPANATDEAAITPAEVAAAEAPFDGAMWQISAAQTACTAGLEELGYNPDRTTVPACVAYDAMQVALWDHAVQVQETLLAADLSGHVATRANADRVRDLAMAKAAAAANDLAAVEALGEVAFVEHNNQIAALTAAGALAAAVAANDLAAELATAIDSATIEGELAAIKSAVESLATDVGDWVGYQRRICDNNPNTSWCS